MSTLDSKFLQGAISPLISFGDGKWSLTYDRTDSGRHRGAHHKILSSKHDPAIDLLGLSGAVIGYLKNTCTRLGPSKSPVEEEECSGDPSHSGGYIGSYWLLGSWKDVFFSCIAACKLLMPL